MSRRVRIVSLFAYALLFARGGAASRPRMHLQDVDVANFAARGEIRLVGSLVELEGEPIGDRGAQSFHLIVSGADIGTPSHVARSEGTREPLDLVLVVESSALYAASQKAAPVVPLMPTPTPPSPAKNNNRRGKAIVPHKASPQKIRKGAPAPPASKNRKTSRAPTPPPVVAPMKQSGPEPIEQVKDAMRELLQGLRLNSRVLLIDYGGDVTTHPPFRAPGAVLSEVDNIQPDDESGDLHLVDALQSAMMELKRLHEKSSGRSLIVVVSDGLNSQMDRTIFRRLGDAANSAQMPIYSLAFSPSDERGPLLNLGELSKRSHGTFRWAKTGAELHTQIQTLVDELNQEYLLTFHIDARSLKGATLTLVSGDLSSNTVRLGNEGALARPLWTSPLAIGIAAIIVLLGGVLAWRKFRGSSAHDFSPPNATATMRVAKPISAKSVQPVLLIVSGALSGQRVILGERALIVGSADGTTQLPNDAAISGRHVQIARVRGAYELTDLNSTNGTYVNNERVGKTLLRDGDLIRVGNTQLKFRLES